MTSRRPLTQAEVEAQILDLCEALETQTEVYDEVSVESANAEADYKLAVARMFLTVAASTQKMTVQERGARADLATNDEFRHFKVADAKRAATREALLSYRARIDALRTLSANVRHQT